MRTRRRRNKLSKCERQAAAEARTAPEKTNAMAIPPASAGMPPAVPHLFYVVVRSFELEGLPVVRYKQNYGRIDLSSLELNASREAEKKSQELMSKSDRDFTISEMIEKLLADPLRGLGALFGGALLAIIIVTMMIMRLYSR